MRPSATFDHVDRMLLIVRTLTAAEHDAHVTAFEPMGCSSLLVSFPAPFIPVPLTVPILTLFRRQSSIFSRKRSTHHDHGMGGGEGGGHRRQEGRGSVWWDC